MKDKASRRTRKMVRKLRAICKNVDFAFTSRRYEPLLIRIGQSYVVDIGRPVYYDYRFGQKRMYTYAELVWFAREVFEQMGIIERNWDGGIAYKWENELHLQRIKTTRKNYDPADESSDESAYRQKVLRLMTKLNPKWQTEEL